VNLAVIGLAAVNVGTPTLPGEMKGEGLERCTLSSMPSVSLLDASEDHA
jgi:hypothetical protein